MSHDGHRILALGERGSWISVDDKAGVAWSGIEKHYPQGCQRKIDWMEKDSPGKISQITLGTNGEYFIKGLAMAAWRLPMQMIKNIDMERIWPTVTVCALGRSGSYIVRWGDQTAWSLNGLYGKLANIMRQQLKVPVKVRPSPARFYDRGLANTSPTIGRSFEFTRRSILCEI